MNQADEVDHAMAEMGGPEFLARRRRWAASMDLDLHAVALALTDPVERWTEDAVLARFVVHLGVQSEPMERYRMLLRVQVAKLLKAGIVTIDADGYALVDLGKVIQFGQAAPHDFEGPITLTEWL